MEENIIQPQPSVDIAPNPTKPWLKIALFSVLGLVLAGGLVFAGIQNGKISNLNPPAGEQISKSQLKIQNLKLTRAPKATSAPTFPPENISFSNTITNWITYTNSQFGYAVKYPPNFIKQEFGQKITVQFYTEPKVNFSITISVLKGVNPMNKTIEEWLDSYAGIYLEGQERDRVISKELVSVGGSTGVKTTIDLSKLNPLAKGFGISVALTKNASVYQFNALIPEGDKQNFQTIFDLMLSTFKFLD